MSLVGLLLAQLAALLGLLLAVSAAGALLTATLPFGSSTERLACALPAGLGAVGTLLFFSGFGRVTIALIALFLPAVAAIFVSRRGGAATPAHRGRVERSLGFLVAGLSAALLPAFLRTLYPPTAFDATAYHLPFARAFVEAGRLVETPDLLFEVFPQLAEALFAAMLAATGSDLRVPLVQLLAVASVALLLFAVARRFYSTRAGVWAAALWLAHPLVQYQASSAYVDATLALFCLFAVVAWEIWREEERGGWLLLAGAAGGWAAATKYLGLIWLVLLGATCLLGSRRGARWRSTAGLLLAAALVAAPWYLRNWSATGNPLHPFFESQPAAPTSPSATGEAARSAPATPDLPLIAPDRLFDFPDEPLSLLRFAWRAAFESAAFDRQAPLAPWNLALIPLAAIFAWRDRRLLRWLLIVLGYTLFWTTTQPRFQLPGAALLALAGGGAIERLAAAVPRVGRLVARRSVAAGLALALLAPGPLYALYKLARTGGSPPTTPAGREAFLERELPGFAGIAWLERERGSSYTVFLFGASNLTYFASGRVRGQARGPWRTGRIHPWLGDPAALAEELRAMGVDYLLATVPASAALPRDDRFRAHFRRVEGDARHELFELAR